MLYIKKEKKNILSIYFFEIKFEIFFNIIYIIETKKTKASENFSNFSQWPHSFLQYTLINLLYGTEELPALKICLTFLQ